MADTDPLLAEILADPAAIAPRLVYADQLIERGDPRGEFIHLQCADPATDDTKIRAMDLLAQHEVAWTHELRTANGLDSHPFQLGFANGFVENVSIRERASSILPALIAATPLRDVSLYVHDAADLARARDSIVKLARVKLSNAQPAAILAFARAPHEGRLRLLKLDGPDAAGVIAGTPELAGLEHLEIAGATGAGLGALLGAEAPLGSLRHLALPSASPDLAALLEGSRWTPQLRGLHIQANRMGPAAIGSILARTPIVESLDLDNIALGFAGARELLGSGLAHLRSLDISNNATGGQGFEQPMYLPELDTLVAQANNLLADGVRWIASSIGFPKLRSLDLSKNRIADAGLVALAATTTLPIEVLHLANTDCTPVGITALAAGPLAPRLVELDLTSTHLADASLVALTSGDRFARLRTLDVSGRTFSAEAIARFVTSPLARRLHAIVFSHLDAAAAGILAAADLPELRSLRADGFDDDALRILAASTSVPKLHHLSLGAKAATDAGAKMLATAKLDRITFLELDAPQVGEAGKVALHDRFGYRVGIFGGALLAAFRRLGRRI